MVAVDPFVVVFLFYGAMAMLGPAIAWHAHWSSEAARLRRALARAQPTRIADATGGVAKIAGRIGAVSTIVAPLSGRNCVHWSVTVRRYDLELLRAERTVDFLVRDGTGKALVSAGGARVLARSEARGTRGSFDPTQPRAAELLRVAGGARSPLYDPERPMTYVEIVLVDGDEVSASGAAQWVLDPDPDPTATGGYREPPKRLEIAGRTGVPVMIGER
jgi:hypothetical protein